MISSINYYRIKAKHIWETANIINELANRQNWKNKKNLTQKESECFEKYGYYLPESVDWLRKFPWVWEKTAKVILYVLYHHPIIAVDTHVHRVANRLWIVKTKEPIETSNKIEKVVPEKRKPVAHHSLILFWRYYCTAKNPKCADCILKSQCNFVKEINCLSFSINNNSHIWLRIFISSYFKFISINFNIFSAITILVSLLSLWLILIFPPLVTIIAYSIIRLFRIVNYLL